MSDPEAFVVEAELELQTGVDPASVGAAVTVELCGHWEHEGACRWPHNNEIESSQQPARFRTLFVADGDEAELVRGRIEAALRSDSGWRVVSIGSRPVAPSERALAERLRSGSQAGHEEGLTFEIQRVLPARRSVVFGAFSEPDTVAKWWGPEGFTIPSIEFEPRVGSTYRIEMQPPDGDSFRLTGEFRHVDPPTSLAFTFSWDPPDPDDVETLARLSLADLGGSTEVTVTQGPFETQARRDLHRDGWRQSLDKLEVVVTAQGTDEHELKRRLASGTAKYLVNPIVRGLFHLGLPAPGIAILETTGRKSGEPRRNPVTNGLDDGVFWIVAEHGRRASYVRNIEANPRVRVRVGRGWLEGAARIVADDDPRERLRYIRSRRPITRLSATTVSVLQTDLLTVRVDLDGEDS